MRRNVALAAWMDLYGFSADELADAINEGSVLVNDGVASRADGRYVRYLLDGTVDWPWLRTRRALEYVFGVSIMELGFIPGGRRASGCRSRGGHTLEGTPGQESDMDRRELLGIVGGAALIVAIPPLPSRGRLSVSDVDRLREPLNRLFVIDSRLGAQDLAKAAAEQALRIRRAVENYQVTDRVQCSMYSLVGEYLAAASWFAIDAGDLTGADRYLDGARKSADLGRDVMLEAQVYNAAALIARERGFPAESHALARRALEGTAARRDPRVRALFHARASYGYAWQGRRSAAERSLGRAWAALDQTHPGDTVPNWLTFVDACEISGQSAITNNVLGRYTEADQQANDSLHQTAPQFARNRVHCVLHSVEAHLGSRDIEQAAAEATVALRLAGGMRSGRLKKRFAAVRSRFDQWPDVPAARAWSERYDTGIPA